MEEQVEQVETEAVPEEGSGQPQLSERETIEQEAIKRYQESQMTQAEKGEGTPEGYNDDGTEAEELLGGKFKSQEDLLKAYQELENKLGQPKEEAPAVEETVEAVAEEVTGGIEVARYEQEFVENGSLSDDSYKNLEKLGFSKNQVDQYIQGQTAYANTVRDSIHNSVGGEEQYTDIITWASGNLPPDIIKDYNDSVEAMNQDKIIRNLEYMKFKKEQSAPTDTSPRRLEGTAASSGLQPYGDKNEWQRAQTNRLYGKDAKYTNMVDSRYLAARKRGIL
tara:strand:- start:5612 stop:6448 length:837 start_codon:yes stop_codon:yes gene_type:complete